MNRDDRNEINRDDYKFAENQKVSTTSSNSEFHDVIANYIADWINEPRFEFEQRPKSDRELSTGLAIIYSKQNKMTRQDYIAAIRNGEYAVEADNWEDLRSIMKECFPKCNSVGMPYDFNNVYSFYRNPYKPECWTVDNELKLKSIKVSTLANMKDETVIKITPENMQRIIDIACATWKDRLASRFANNIVLKLDTFISQSFYQDMRSACTEVQHKLFDEIFGPDVPDFKVGDFITDDKRMPGKVFEIMDSNSSNPKLRILNPDVGDTDEYRMYGAESVRHATPEEIRAAQYPPDGIPCWVRNSVEPWQLRYATGGGKFYKNQRRYGETVEYVHFKPFDPNNLPFNT